MTRALSGHVLILTGPPGAGKTTTAMALTSGAEGPAVHLHTDDFWHCIRHGAIPPYLPAAHEQNKVVMNVLAAAAAGYARGGYFVVLDGIIGPWFLEPFRSLNVPLHYVVLRPALEAVLARAKARGGGALKSSGPIRALHAQFSTLGPFESHAVDTTAQDPATTLATVRARLDGTWLLGTPTA